MFLAKKWQAFDACLRQGRVAEVQAALPLLAREVPTREDRATLSTLARRAGLPEIGLRLLAPVVKPGGLLNPLARPLEVAEYAACLIRIGAVGEAEMLLESLREQDVPQLSFLRALGAIARWDYVSAEVRLRRFIQRGDIAPYERLVATVNRIAALAYEERFADVEAELPIAMEQAAVEDSLLLQANLFEIAAQTKIAMGDEKVAESLLSRAEEILGECGTIYSFFIRKWRAVLAARRGKLRAFDEVEAEAHRIAHFESLRDLDFHRACITRESAKWDHLIYGSPHAVARARYERERKKIAEGKDIPGFYVRVIGSGPAKVELDLRTGQATSSDHALKVGQLPHRLLLALNSDFYRPIRLAELHAALFSETAFHLQESKNRVHQACRRLRVFFQEAKIPLIIATDAFGFRLTAASGYRVFIAKHADTNPTSAMQAQVVRQVTSFTSGKGRFTGQEFAVATGLKPRTSQRYLHMACKIGLIQQVGERRARVYLTTKNISGDHPAAHLNTTALEIDS